MKARGFQVVVHWFLVTVGPDDVILYVSWIITDDKQK